MADNQVSNDNKAVDKTAPVSRKPSQLPARNTVEFTDVENLQPAPVRAEYGIGTKVKAAAERTAVTPSTNAVAYTFINSDFTADNKLIISGDKIVAATCNVTVEKPIRSWSEYLCISPRTAEITLPSTTGGIATLRRTSFKKVDEIADNIDGFYQGLREITPKIEGNTIGITALLTEIPQTLLIPNGESRDQYVSRLYNFSAPLAAPLYSKPNLSSSNQSLEIDKIVGKTPEGDLIANISSNQNTGDKSETYILAILSL